MQWHRDPGGSLARQEAGCRDFQIMPGQAEPLPFQIRSVLSGICSEVRYQFRVRSEGWQHPIQPPSRSW